MFAARRGPDGTPTTPDEPQGLELFLLKLRYQEADMTSLEGNEAFLLADPASAWVVYTGQVDVFAVPLRNGTIAGARRHLFRAGVGTVLCGIASAGGPTADGAGVGLLASGSPGTRVLQIARERLQVLAADLEYSEVVAGLLDRWIDGLSRSMARAIPPKAPLLLDAEQTATVPAGQAALPRRGVLWVRPDQGGTQLLGQPDLPLPDGAFTPLTRAIWAQAVTPSVLYAVPTVTLLENDPGWTALAAFQRLALQAIQVNQGQDATAEQERLRQKAAAQQAVVEQAFSRIAGLLEPAAAPSVADLPGTAGDPLLRACMLVGQAQGITIHPPPRPGDPARAGHATQDQLRQIAQASYIRTRQIALKGEWWREDNGPLLAFRAPEDRPAQPVALLPTAPGHYDLVDPGSHTRTPLTAAVAATLGPFGAAFYRPFPPRALTAWDLLRFGAADMQRDVRTIVLVGIAMGLLGMLPALATGIIFDTLIPGAERSLLLAVGALLLAIALASALFQVARSIAVLRLEGKLGAGVQAAVWDRLLSLPVPFFRDYSSGDLGVRAMGINTIRQILSGTVLTTILSSLFSIFNLGLLFYYNAGLALVAVGLVLLSVLVTTAAGVVQIRYQRTLTTVEGQIAGLVLQIINGIAKFRVAGAEPRAFALWAEQFSKQKALAYQARAVANSLAVFNAVYPILTAMAIFVMVAMTSPGPEGTPFTTGRFLAFNAAFAVLLVSGLRLSGAFLSILSIVPIYERARPILRTLPEVDEARVDPGELAGAIEVNHVSFRYKANGPTILHDVSLHIAPGEFVALVGPSGSGKSTLFRMLLGFETPESGVIYYDGQDLAGLDPRAVRQQVGVVLQNGKLMAGDIFQNITGGSLLTLEDAWAAARLAGLEDDLKQMPMGMHTMISEGGGTLSGGQQQRLLIARAIARRPRVLFFDEATSALDNRTQEIISQSLEDLQATRIVIAHRLSTILNADRIYVLDGGRIVQTGTYSELVDQPGLFAELAKRQLV